MHGEYFVKSSLADGGKSSSAAAQFESGEFGMAQFNGWRLKHMGCFVFAEVEEICSSIWSLG